MHGPWDVLVCDEDLEAIDDLCQWDSFVTTLPFLEGFKILNDDNVIVLLTLVVDLSHASLSSGHLDGLLVDFV